MTLNELMADHYHPNAPEYQSKLALAFYPANIEHTTINFVIGKEMILQITKDGLIYKGTLIEDAGEVYKLFTQYLNDYSMR